MVITENWRFVVGYEGLYEVSDQGRVRSLDRIVTYAAGGRRLFKGRILKAGHSKGYPRVNLYRDGKQSVKFALVHQLVLAAFVGPLPEGQEVRHYDGNRKNCSLGNLLYGTRSENYFDKYRHGKDVRGERHGMSFLSENDIKEIRRLCFQGFTQAEIARKFNVDPSHVSRINSREAWGHV